MEQSQTINELAKALAKLQGELKTVPKDKVNPFHKSKYADLSAIWEMCRKPLADNGISLVQTTDLTENNILLETTLLHSSGEWLRGKLSLNPVKLDPQGVGSAITYGRRYAMCAMLGIAADEDDDAEASTHRVEDKKASLVKSPEKKSPVSLPKSEETEASLEWFKQSLKDLNWNPLSWIKDQFKITGDKVSEVVALMTKEQKDKFASEIKSRLASKEVK